jgi:hypothetical protein
VHIFLQFFNKLYPKGTTHVPPEQQLYERISRDPPLVQDSVVLRATVPPLRSRPVPSMEHTDIFSHQLVWTWRTTTMIGGDHSALSYKQPAGGMVGGAVAYPLCQNKVTFLHLHEFQLIFMPWFPWSLLSDFYQLQPDVGNQSTAFLLWIRRLQSDLSTVRSTSD